MAALLARVYSSISFAGGGRIAYIHITREDFSQTGTTALDTQQFADIPRAIEGVEVAVYFREEKDDNYKVSFRANGDFDLLSYGKDGQPGGEDENADINNWEVEQ